MLNNTISLFRGHEFPKMEHPIDLEEHDDGEADAVQGECLVSEEDMLFSRHVPCPLFTLPGLLRGTFGGLGWHKKWTSNQLLESKRSEMVAKVLDLLSYIFTDDIRPRLELQGCILRNQSLLAYETCGSMIFLEYLPMLRLVARVEKAAEHAFQISDGEERSKTRRVTRRTAKASRCHYFDSISREMKLDNFDLNASQVGSLLAAKQLIYRVVDSNGSK